MEENQNSTPPPSPSVATQQTSISLGDADPSIDKTSREKLSDQLPGIFFGRKAKEVWVNKKLNCNCFMIYAKSLDISWKESPQYWKWEKFEESRGTWIEVAELISVCWMDVRGKLDTNKLSPGVMYGVSFHVKLKNSAYWSAKVSLKLAGVKYEEHDINCSEMVRETWMEIPVAQFVAPAHDDEAGQMEFCLWDHDGYWKSGLIVKGVSIKPL